MATILTSTTPFGSGGSATAPGSGGEAECSKDAFSSKTGMEDAPDRSGDVSVNSDLSSSSSPDNSEDKSDSSSMVLENDQLISFLDMFPSDFTKPVWANPDEYLDVYPMALNATNVINSTLPIIPPFCTSGMVSQLPAGTGTVTSGIPSFSNELYPVDSSPAPNILMESFTNYHLPGGTTNTTATTTAITTTSNQSNSTDDFNMLFGFQMPTANSFAYTPTPGVIPAAIVSNNNNNNNVNGNLPSTPPRATATKARNNKNANSKATTSASKKVAADSRSSVNSSTTRKSSAKADDFPASFPPPSGYFSIADALTISEQPAQFGRFRYRSEKREKSLEGESTYPEVMVNPEILRTATSAVVNVSLTTRHGAPHWHQLEGVTEVTLTPKQCRAQFKQLFVFMDKGQPNDQRNKDDQRVVRLRFDLIVHWSDSKKGICTVLSKPIYNTKLLISRISHSYCPASGGQDVIILTSKVRKNTTYIRINDVSNTSFSDTVSPTATNRWIRRSDNCGQYYILPSGDLDFHHQFAIMAKLPPYHDQEITKPVDVEIVIMDVEDNIESVPFTFTYTPNESLMRQEHRENKKRRINDDMDNLYGDSNNGNNDLGGNGNQNSTNGGNSNGGGQNIGGNGYGGSIHGHNASMDGSKLMSITSSLENDDKDKIIHQLQQQISELKKMVDPRHMKFFAATGDLKILIRSQLQSLKKPDDDGDTPLHHAMEQRNNDVAMTLIECLGNEDINKKNASYDTPLHLAIWNRSYDIIKKLLKNGVQLDILDGNGRLPIHLACELGDLTALQLLTNTQKSQCTVPNLNGATALHICTEKNRLDMVNHLLDIDVSPSPLNVKSKQTPLHIAARLGFSKIAETLLKRDSSKTLCHFRDNDGNTPLHSAIFGCHLDIIRNLVFHGVDVFAVNEEGKTWYQCMREKLPAVNHEKILGYVTKWINQYYSGRSVEDIDEEDKMEMDVTPVNANAPANNDKFRDTNEHEDDEEEEDEEDVFGEFVGPEVSITTRGSADSFYRNPFLEKEDDTLDGDWVLVKNVPKLALLTIHERDPMKNQEKMTPKMKYPMRSPKEYGKLAGEAKKLLIKTNTLLDPVTNVKKTMATSPGEKSAYLDKISKMEKIEPTATSGTMNPTLFQAH